MFADSLVAVTCIPENFYPDICALLPTYSIVFHSSNSINHHQFTWFIFIDVQDMPSEYCIVTLRPIVPSLQSLSLKIQGNRKKLFQFFPLGSMIGLFNFELSSSLSISLSEETIIATVGNLNNAPCNFAETENNFINSNYSQIENLSNASNDSRFFILGTFIRISERKNVDADGKILDSVKVQIADHSGIKEIESQGAFAEKFIKLFVGQVVLISNLSKSKETSKGEVVFYALSEYQAKITVISSLETLLTSKSLLCWSKLSSIEAPSFQLSEIQISAHTLPPFCTLAHSICQRPLILRAGVSYCSFCKIEIESSATEQAQMVYSIIWSIYEDSKTLNCEALSCVNSTLIGAHAEEFHTFPLNTQKKILEKVLQKKYRVGLVAYHNDENEPHTLQFRLDMVTEITKT